ncbi:MAG: tetratricopeptide repeat protein [Bryobacteraceae bacterium]|nr:tetratricopeptide repeat protein [Bryobacteraceae bacterium]
MLRCFLYLLPVALAAGDLEKARDAQDRAALARLIEGLSGKAKAAPQNAAAQYQLAYANSLLAEVAIEQRDKAAGKSAAETGIAAAEKAVALDGKNSEYHRLLGTLCGQVIPANVLAGLKYGRCALESVNKAIELNPKSGDNYLARGVGNYYLPESFGGGVNKAIGDIEKAIQLNPKSSDAHVWYGVALRKANRNAEARKAFETALKLNPARVWAKQQLDKTPAQ